jgi:hypothetical protein
MQSFVSVGAGSRSSIGNGCLAKAISDIKTTQNSVGAQGLAPLLTCKFFTRNHLTSFEDIILLRFHPVGKPVTVHRLRPDLTHGIDERWRQLYDVGESVKTPEVAEGKAVDNRLR